MKSGNSWIRGRFYALGREPLKKLILHRANPIFGRGEFHRQVHREDPPVWSAPSDLNKPGLEAFGYSTNSENGEGGILRRLFNEISFGFKTFSKFGSEDAHNNSARLFAGSSLFTSKSG